MQSGTEICHFAFCFSCTTAFYSAILYQLQMAALKLRGVTDLLPWGTILALTPADGVGLITGQEHRFKATPRFFTKHFEEWITGFNVGTWQGVEKRGILLEAETTSHFI